MGTILFHEIIFGPIKSRRLGTSLGVNLLPYDGKLCSFDCIYCECGYNKDGKTNTKLPDRENVNQALLEKLLELKKIGTNLDVITFAGNGEPTIHPEFEQIIDDTIKLRNLYFPTTKISVLSNAMHINKQSVVNALKKIDNNILKLDSAIIETAMLMDRPNSKEYNIEKQVELLEQFEGNFIIQTMFLKGNHQGKYVNNTTDEEVSLWLEMIKKANPKEVMIYTIDRVTPEKNLEKIPIEKLKEIAQKVEELGIKSNVAG